MLSLLGVPLNKNYVSVLNKCHPAGEHAFAACGSLVEPGEHSADQKVSVLLQSLIMFSFLFSFKGENVLELAELYLEGQQQVFLHVPLSCRMQLVGGLCLSQVLVLMISGNAAEQQLVQGSQIPTKCVAWSLTNCCKRKHHRNVSRLYSKMPAFPVSLSHTLNAELIFCFSILGCFLVLLPLLPPLSLNSFQVNDVLAEKFKLEGIER